MKLEWQKFTYTNLDDALSKKYCLYVFHHPDDGDQPFYIGKAKFFGPKQEDGYKGSARYNAGYHHLLYGLIRSGFTLYISEIGEKHGFRLADIRSFGQVVPDETFERLRLINSGAAATAAG